MIAHLVAALALTACAVAQWLAGPRRPCCAPGCHDLESRGHLCARHLAEWTAGYGAPSGWWVVVGGLTCVREESGVDGRPLRELVRDAGEWWAPTRRLTPPTGVAPRG